MEEVVLSIAIVATLVTMFFVPIDKEYLEYFEFKTLSTTCEDFTINGSAAYNKDKTAIHISDVEYWFVYGMMFVVLMVCVMASSQVAKKVT